MAPRILEYRPCLVYARATSAEEAAHGFTPPAAPLRNGTAVFQADNDCA
ncbi:MAG: hypothetical protein GDA53_06030 [Rhodobacteraceae bacterium]|nr:hypothetical protein [Paracoccaceae bacterium]